MLAHVLRLSANPTLHCKAIEGPATTRNRNLTEEQDIAVLCFNHPNGSKKTRYQNSHLQSLEDYPFSSKASQSVANERIGVEACTQPNKSLNLSGSF
jgi:hypothetical protein